MPIKIAGVQMDVALGKPDQNLSRIEQFAAEAANAGAKFIVFPECAITGYCFESLDDARVWAEPVPGPAVERLTALCSRLGVHVVVGLLEGSPDPDGDVYNACVCVGPGGLLGNYRKVHLPKLGVDHFTTPGDRPFAVHDTGELRIGMNICYDASFPEAARALTLAGADLIVLPTNWPPGAEQTAAYVINARASENKVFFIAVNRVGRERGFQFIGRSKICDVHGTTLAKASAEDEEILYAEIEPAEARDKQIVRVPGKHAIDRLADRRPEFYRTLLDPPG